MLTVFAGILRECWHILLEAAPYVLFGFFAAGLLKTFLPEGSVARHLGRSDSRSVVKAALFGIPLPLCSCGVIPAAISLRQQGASRGATASFLVSVPETGVDSIAITWALLDPLMTVLRPIAAFITATITGLLIHRLPEEKVASQPAASVCLCEDNCCGHHPAGKPTLFGRIRQGQAYAFGELLGDIGSWLLLGIGLAGIISYLLPDDFFVRFLDQEFLSLLVMLLVGIPLYICASASTPVAAALMLKGLSPGAALVFLLAGPATNIATITVVSRFFGRAATIVYIISIAACSLLLGWLVNLIYRMSGISLQIGLAETVDRHDSILAVISALLVLGLIIWNRWGKKLLDRNDGGCGCGGKS